MWVIKEARLEKWGLSWQPLPATALFPSFSSSNWMWLHDAYLFGRLNDGNHFRRSLRDFDFARKVVSCSTYLLIFKPGCFNLPFEDSMKLRIMNISLQFYHWTAEGPSFLARLSYYLQCFRWWWFCDWVFSDISRIRLIAEIWDDADWVSAPSMTYSVQSSLSLGNVESFFAIFSSMGDPRISNRWIGLLYSGAYLPLRM